MTSVIARQPLEPLSMSSAQRSTRRRSAKQAFEGEELAARTSGKKARLESNSSAVPMQTVNTTATDKLKRRSKKIGKNRGVGEMYEDVDDGFQFSKTRTKKPKSQPLQPSRSVHEDRESSTQQKTGTSPLRRMKESQPEDEPYATGSRRRRSARLSGSNQLLGTQLEPAIQETKPKRLVPRKTMHDFHEPDEHVALVAVKKHRPSSRPVVEKARPHPGSDHKSIDDKLPSKSLMEKPKSPTRIALPFADTPIIRRNKELRRGDKGSRRSSTGTRGLRASSLMDSGSSNAVPHSEVDVDEFYKHIAQSILEPRRMKQLLVWCGSRALPDKPTGGGKDTSALMAARAIEQELLEEFAQRSDLSDWFNREDMAPRTITKKPNPRNERMTEMVQELEEEIERLEEEEHAWKTVADLAATKPAPIPLSPEFLSSEHLDDGIQSSILALVMHSRRQTAESSEDGETTAMLFPVPTGLTTLSPSTSAPRLTSRLNAATASLEPRIDIFADGIHQLCQYRMIADQVADRILAAAASELDAREKDAKGFAGTTNIGVDEVLGVLSKVAGERARAGR